MSVDYWLDFIEDNKNPVKCDWCEQLVPTVVLYWVEEHWSLSRKLTAFCKECEERWAKK